MLSYAPKKKSAIACWKTLTFPQNIKDNEKMAKKPKETTNSFSPSEEFRKRLKDMATEVYEARPTDNPLFIIDGIFGKKFCVTERVVKAYKHAVKRTKREFKIWDETLARFLDSWKPSALVMGIKKYQSSVDAHDEELKKVNDELEDYKKRCVLFMMDAGYNE